MVVPGAIVKVVRTIMPIGCIEVVTGSSEEVRPAFAQPSAFTMIPPCKVIALALVSPDRCDKIALRSYYN